MAKDKIEKNETISTKKLEMMKMPEKPVLPQSLKILGDAEGKIATSVIEKGETVLHTSCFRKRRGIYVSRKVREGFRAVSVGVNFNQSVSNLIEPENVVDVVFTKENKDKANQLPPSSTILIQKARVFAVGRKIVTPEQSKEKYVEYTSVTLQVKPDDALTIINASEQGKIQFILYKRPKMDEDKN